MLCENCAPRPPQPPFKSWEEPKVDPRVKFKTKKSLDKLKKLDIMKKTNTNQSKTLMIIISTSTNGFDKN